MRTWVGALLGLDEGAALGALVGAVEGVAVGEGVGATEGTRVASVDHSQMEPSGPVLAIALDPSAATSRSVQFWLPPDVSTYHVVPARKGWSKGGYGVMS